MYYVSSSTFSGFYPTVERPKKLAKSGLVYLWSCSSPGRRRNSKYHAIHWRGPRSNYLDYNGIVVYLLLLHSSTGFGSMGKVSRNKPTFIYILTYLHVGSTLVQNDMKNVVEIIRKNKNKYVHFPQFNRRVSFTKLLRRCYIKISHVFVHPQFRSVIRNIENHCAILTLVVYYYRLINFICYITSTQVCRREQWHISNWI